MNCNEAIEYIHSLEKFGMRPGLERIGELCRALGEPQKGLKIIHVAGTNGNGFHVNDNILHSAKSGIQYGAFYIAVCLEFQRENPV